MKKEKEPEIGLLQATERELVKSSSRGKPEEDADASNAVPKQASLDNEQKPPVRERLKSYLIAIFIFLLVLLGVVAGVFFNGLRDLRDDNRYLVVVQENNIPKAAVLYQLKMRQSEPFNIGALPSTVNMEEFFAFARENEQDVIDRVIVVHVSAITTLTKRDAITYADQEIQLGSVIDYLLDARPLPLEIKGEDEADWVTKSKLLGVWVKQYHDAVWKGEDDYAKLLEQYRLNVIYPYPSNGALFLLKILPMEKLIS